MIPASYQAKKKFMELAIAEAKRAGDRGDYPIGAVITRVSGKSETIIASAETAKPPAPSSTLNWKCSNMFRAAMAGTCPIL
jgi:hypothetical protein